MLNKYKNINTMNHTIFENKDLVDILNFQTIHKPLHKRIKLDFSKKNKATHISSPLSDEEFVVPMPIDKSSTDLYPHLREKTKKRNNRRKSKRKSKRKSRRKSHITHKIYKKSKRNTTSIGDLL